MNISRDIKPVTYLKANAADLLKQINETRCPVIITQNGEPRAVLQDPESYENMRNAIGILKGTSKNSYFQKRSDRWLNFEKSECPIG
jgi:prevent-host-death family protein